MKYNSNKLAISFNLFYILTNLLIWVSYTYFMKVYLNYAVIVFLFLLIVCFFINKKDVNIYAHNIPLFLLFIGYIITLFIVNKVPMIDSLKSLAWLFILTIYFVLFNKNILKDEKYREIEIISVVLICITFLISTISLSFLFTGNRLIIDSLPSWKINNGIFENRLYGIVGNPNILSAIAIISLFLSMILIIDTRRNYKYIFITNMIIQLITISATNSRSGFIAVCISSAVIILVFNKHIFKFIKNKKNSKYLHKRILFSLLLFSAIISFTKYSSVIIIDIRNRIVENILNIEMMNDIPIERNIIADKKLSDEVIKEDIIKKVDINRFDPVESNYIRLSIFKEGIEVFKTSPIMGVSDRNISETAKKLFNYSYLYNKGSLHNSILHVLCSAGLYGFIMLMLFIYYVIKKNIKYFFKTKGIYTKDDKMVAITFIFMVVLTVITMTNFTLLYMNSFISATFWWIVGLNMYFLEKELNSKSKTLSLNFRRFHNLRARNKNGKINK